MPTTAVQTPSQCGGNEPTRPRPVFTEARQPTSVTRSHLPICHLPPFHNYLPPFRIRNICHSSTSSVTFHTSTAQRHLQQFNRPAPTTVPQPPPQQPHTPRAHRRGDTYIAAAQPSASAGTAQREAGTRHVQREAGSRRMQREAGTRHVQREAGSRHAQWGAGSRHVQWEAGTRHALTWSDIGSLTLDSSLAAPAQHSSLTEGRALEVMHATLSWCC